MRNRWTILATLFVARAAMAFQFQSVASVAPQLEQGMGATLADIGLLIGLYFAPGAALALPGGALGRRFGDKPTVVAGLTAMLAGELLMAASPAWSVQMAGRLVAGAGAVLLNVLMTKMLTDWFARREIATAMGVFVNSWPVGIALSLMVLPWLGATFGLHAVHGGVAALVAISMGLVGFGYRAPETLQATDGKRGKLDARIVRAVIAAGLLWSLYNVGFAMIFSFGPSALVTRGWSVTAAGSTISIVLWLTTLSVPFGGLLADRTQRGGTVLVAGCIVFALLALALSRTGQVLAVVIALGLICGLPAGSIMSLPARVLDPATRSVGMGLFYTVYYVGMLVAPAIAGKLSTIVGSASAALDFGAVALLACPVVLWVFHLVAGPSREPASIVRKEAS